MPQGTLGMQSLWYGLLCALCSGGVWGAGTLKGPLLITGATGRTGVLAYNRSRILGIPVRALVRSADKARELLGCQRCDESEGIFVGDIMDPATLVAPMKGAATLVIATSSIATCNPFPNCTFPEGGEPINIDWIGAKAQLEAFANATCGQGSVVLISTMGTTEPEAYGHFGDIGFYKLNFETALATSGLPFTIVKPCGLTNTPPSMSELLVGHDDTLTERTVTRADVARVVVAAVQAPAASAGLRFDLCSRPDGPPTTDAGLADLFAAARYPWQRRAKAANTDTLIV